MSTVAEAPQVVEGKRRGTRTSTAGYWIALAILVVGVVSAVVWGIESVAEVADRADRFPHAAAPGEVVVQVTEAGDQMVYFSGAPDASHTALGLEVVGPDGSSLPLTPYERSLDVDIAGRAGRAVATFSADAPGTYTVKSDPIAGYGGTVAVGENVVKQLLPDALGSLALAWVSVLVAVAVASVTLVLRSRRT